MAWREAWRVGRRGGRGMASGARRPGARRMAFLMRRGERDLGARGRWRGVPCGWRAKAWGVGRCWAWGRREVRRVECRVGRGEGCRGRRRAQGETRRGRHFGRRGMECQRAWRDGIRGAGRTGAVGGRARGLAARARGGRAVRWGSGRAGLAGRCRRGGRGRRAGWGRRGGGAEGWGRRGGGSEGWGRRGRGVVGRGISIRCGGAGRGMPGSHRGVRGSVDPPWHRGSGDGGRVASTSVGRGPRRRVRG